MTTENAFYINNRTETTTALTDDRDMLILEIEYDKRRLDDTCDAINRQIDLGAMVQDVIELTQTRQRLARQIHANELELAGITDELARRERNQRAGMPL